MLWLFFLAVVLVHVTSAQDGSRDEKDDDNDDDDDDDEDEAANRTRGIAICLRTS